ncbi:MAG: hypothetical protein AAF628_27750 [Planctomycetota bacterium]
MDRSGWLALALAAGLAAQGTAQGSCAAAPQVQGLGGGSPGTSGVARLVAATPRAGLPFAVQLNRGLPGAFGSVLFSGAAAPVFIPEFAATIHPDLSQAGFQLFLVDAAGMSPPKLQVRAIPAFACGASFYVQALLLDPAAAGGVAVSDALRVTVGGSVGAAPLVDPVISPTAASSVTLNGSASTAGNRLVVQSGASQVETTLGTGGQFSVAVPLQPDRLNRLFLREELLAGVFSAPGSVDVVQDGTPPDLFIDFPADGATLHTATTDVAGRVGDRLSGFAGLAVSVAGQPAVVNPGIGTNGTFEAQGVALALGSNTISVVASDALGNQTTKTITVNRGALAGASLVEVSGGGQQGMVDSELPTPLVVRLTDASGQPFAGKVITFDVTRSDGRLAAQQGGPGAMMLQAIADASGEARAWWTLGSDAGCGNNRVTVSSASIASAVYFCAGADAAPPRQINIGTGGSQVTRTGGTPPEPLVAWVHDGNNGAAGVPVTFSIVEGSGCLTSPGASGSATQITVTSSTTGHASCVFTAGPIPGNQRIEASFAGNPGAPATFVVFSVDAPGPDTRFAGIVLDNSQQPVEGATCTLQIGSSPPLIVATDASGHFAFEQLAESGLASLKVDGATATAVGGVPVDPATLRLPYLHFAPLVIDGADNGLPAPVLLPRLSPANDVVYDGSQEAELKVTGIDGLVLRVAPGTAVTHPDGRPVTPFDPITLSLNQVHADDIPMPMPNGAAPPFAWTLQPAGATFSPPVRVEMPNMQGLPPGAVAYILSFDHDTEQFEIVATASVTSDGSCIISDPASGISTAGWGGWCPPYPPVGSAEPCGVSIGYAGPGYLCFDESTVLTAVNETPAGGSFSWSVPAGSGLFFDTGSSSSLSATGRRATLKAGSAPSGPVNISLSYTPVRGAVCTTQIAVSIAGVLFDTSIVNPRNLFDPDRTGINKCVGVLHDPANNAIDLEPLLAPGVDTSALFWKINGVTSGPRIVYSTLPPRDDYVYEYRVQVIDVRCPLTAGGNDWLDISVHPRNTEDAYRLWRATQTDPQIWASGLPAPYTQAGASVGDPEPPCTPPPRTPYGLWQPPCAASNPLCKFFWTDTYHPGAAYEMRSTAIPGVIPGHQATYDQAGVLIKASGQMLVAAGTADRVSPDFLRAAHIRDDVRPFIQAAQLDGNAVEPWMVTGTELDYARLKGRLVFAGVNLRAYLSYRPDLTAVTRPPETCGQ